VTDGDAVNEGIYEVVDRQTTTDPCMDAHFKYGTRVGYRRIAELFSCFAVPLTLSACGRAVERSPWLANDAIQRGHEISVHGYRWPRAGGLAHMRMIARPGRIAALEHILKHLAHSRTAWVTTRQSIAQHWLAQSVF
jgi:peptidoglycan/xylan/chitin deacetylase (PgdA/CDA1 family)